MAKLLPYDAALDNIQVQKQATPVAPFACLEKMADRLQTQKPNAVVLEKSSYDDADINAQRIAAVRHFASRLDYNFEEDLRPEESSEGEESKEGEEEKSVAQKRRRVDQRGSLSEEPARKIVEEQTKRRRVQRKACATGNTMIDKFEPWYFGIAFAFLFSYCTGMPDMPVFARRERYRRAPNAPRIECNLWVRVLSLIHI